MKYSTGRLLAGIILIAMGALVLTVNPLPWNLRGILYAGLGVYMIFESKRP